MPKVKERTVLDQVKQVEAQIKKHLLMKKLADLKKMAKKRLEIQEETRLILDEIGIHGDDAKQVIDYINEQVKLTESDKATIRERVTKDVEEEKVEIEEKAPQLMTLQAAPDWLQANWDWQTDVNDAKAEMFKVHNGNSMMMNTSISSGTSLPTSDVTFLNSLDLR